MEILLKAAAYLIFIAGSLLFFFKGTKRPENNRIRYGVIITISVILLSYYYWFRI